MDRKGKHMDELKNDAELAKILEYRKLNLTRLQNADRPDTKLRMKHTLNYSETPKTYIEQIWVNSLTFL
jgi:hypothetical protein